LKSVGKKWRDRVGISASSGPIKRVDKKSYAGGHFKGQKCIKVALATNVLEYSAGITLNIMHCQGHCSVTENVFYPLP
jgi:hypothetical protein